MKTLEEIKKEFEKFWTDLFGGEYDGTHPQGQIWNFIESTISQTKQELVEEIKKEYEGFDMYLLPKFVKKVTGVDKDGMLFAGMAVNLDELLESTISQTKQELVEEIKKEIESSLAYGDEYCESEDCHWGDAQSIVDGVLEKLSNK